MLGRPRAGIRAGGRQGAGLSAGRSRSAGSPASWPRGLRRVARSDPAAGARHCRTVAELLAALPESRESLTLELTSRIALLEIGRLAGIAESDAEDLFGQARGVAERLGDRGGQAFLLTSFGRLRGLAGDVYRAATVRTGKNVR